MEQKLKLTVKQIPWSLACKVVLVCLSVWWQSIVLFVFSIMLATIWPLIRMRTTIPLAIGLIVICLTMPQVAVLWVLMLCLALIFIACKERVSTSNTSIYFLEYAVVAMGLVVFFAQTEPFFSAWTGLWAASMAVWFFFLVKNYNKNYLLAGINALVWWQLLVAILLLPVAVGIQAFLAYAVLVLVAEYGKNKEIER